MEYLFVGLVVGYFSRSWLLAMAMLLPITLAFAATIAWLQTEAGMTPNLLRIFALNFVWLAVPTSITIGVRALVRLRERRRSTA